MRMLVFRRFRSDQPTDDPIAPSAVTAAQPHPSPSGLPQVADLAEVVLNRSERAFGRQGDGTLLERFALEAVIDVLSGPSPSLDASKPNQPSHGHHAHTERNAA